MNVGDAAVGQTLTREKRGATLQSIAALRGWVASPTTTDHGSPAWVLSRAAETLAFPSIEAAEAYLDYRATE